MTNDEIADGFKVLFDAAHENQACIEDEACRRWFGRKLNRAHSIMNEMHCQAKDLKMIQPNSGGTPKEN